MFNLNIKEYNNIKLAGQTNIKTKTNIIESVFQYNYK